MLKVNHSKRYHPINIKKIELNYNAVYIGDFQTKKQDGSWNDIPYAIFYCEKPDKSKGHSNYFGILTTKNSLNENKVYILDGSSAVEEPFNAIQADNGEYVISSFRHDYRTSTDGSVMIDGGRDYNRYIADRNLVKLKLNKDKFEIVND